MANIDKLARFIASLGSLNEYGSTIAQTKKALETENLTYLSSQTDQVIFQDALKGIKAIQKTGFNVDGIIAVNKQFDGDSNEQPTMPGHLRNAYYNPGDQIAITLDPSGRTHYIPKEVVSRDDLDQIVTEFEMSEQTSKAAWLVFVRLSKLQPFQDGNKRTALIVANHAVKALETQNYLLIPENPLDRMDFTTALMRYYAANGSAEEQLSFDRLYRIVNMPVSQSKPTEYELPDAKTKHYKIKETFSTNKHYDKNQTY